MSRKPPKRQCFIRSCNRRPARELHSSGYPVCYFHGEMLAHPMRGTPHAYLKVIEGGDVYYVADPNQGEITLRLKSRLDNEQARVLLAEIEWRMWALQDAFTGVDVEKRSNSAGCFFLLRYPIGLEGIDVGALSEAEKTSIEDIYSYIRPKLTFKTGTPQNMGFIADGGSLPENRGAARQSWRIRK